MASDERPEKKNKAPLRPITIVVLPFAIIFFAFLIYVAAFLTIAFTSSIPKMDYIRYRLTYEIETPSGIQTASGVFEYEVQNIPSGHKYGHLKTGEAIAIDLGGGKYLFSLLRDRITRDANPWLTAVLRKSFRDIQRDRPSADLSFDMLPLLATFDDLGDPYSLSLVNPTDLSRRFGPGTKLKRVSLEITDDPPTTGRLSEQLYWLDHWKYWLNGRNSIRTYGEDFYRSDFIR